MINLFVCLDALHPSQHFSHVGMSSRLPVLNQYLTVDTMSSSRTQHSDPDSGEPRTSNPSLDPQFHTLPTELMLSARTLPALNLELDTHRSPVQRSTNSAQDDQTSLLKSFIHVVKLVKMDKPYLEKLTFKFLAF